MQDIWDSIAVASEEMSLTDTQHQELERRLERYREDPSAGKTWDEVKKFINRS